MKDGAIAVAAGLVLGKPSMLLVSLNLAILTLATAYG